mmetsp:Transcript_24816/g.42165  ORF Transcript_24816/g.42165 Transcript_24816/m.42165 type:complete len:415 (+) Transcript_24816:277-1521(+)
MVKFECARKNCKGTQRNKDYTSVAASYLLAHEIKPGWTRICQQCYKAALATRTAAETQRHTRSGHEQVLPPVHHFNRRNEAEFLGAENQSMSRRSSKSRDTSPEAQPKNVSKGVNQSSKPSEPEAVEVILNQNDVQFNLFRSESSSSSSSSRYRFWPPSRDRTEGSPPSSSGVDVPLFAPPVLPALPSRIEPSPPLHPPKTPPPPAEANSISLSLPPAATGSPSSVECAAGDAPPTERTRTGVTNEDGVSRGEEVSVSGEVEAAGAAALLLLSLLVGGSGAEPPCPELDTGRVKSWRHMGQQRLTLSQPLKHCPWNRCLQGVCRISFPLSKGSMQIGHAFASPSSSALSRSWSSFSSESVATTRHCSRVPTGAASEVDKAPCLMSMTKMAVESEVKMQAMASTNPVHTKRLTER